MVEVAIAKAAVPDEEMDDEPQEDEVGCASQTAGRIEASPRARTKIRVTYECLQDHETRERGELLIFESRFGARLAVGDYVCLTSLHRRAFLTAWWQLISNTTGACRL